MSRCVIKTRDRELYGMMYVWLTDAGYEASYDGDGDVYIIDAEAVDNVNDFADRDDVVVISDGGELERPFSRLELIDAVRGKSFDRQEGTFVLSVEKKRVSYGRSYVTLSPKETEILSFLNSHRGEAVPRDVISRIAQAGDQDTNAADVYICMIRKKLTKLLGASPIVTVRGVGYMLKK